MAASRYRDLSDDDLLDQLEKLRSEFWAAKWRVKRLKMSLPDAELKRVLESLIEKERVLLAVIEEKVRRGLA